MRIFVFILLSFVHLAGLAVAQSYIPERQKTVYRDLDFVGQDLQQLFDTTLEACERACTADTRCVGYTFNTRSNSCFPKSSLTDRADYVGATSATMPLRPAQETARAEARAKALGFLFSYELDGALRQANALPSRHPSSRWSADEMRGAVVEREGAGDVLNAFRWAGATAAMTDEAADWTAYARLSLALKAAKNSDRRRNAEAAKTAAINGYLRAASGTAEANALYQLSIALERLGHGERTIPALKLANAAASSPLIEDRLTQMRAQYGFRVVNTKVENDLAEPRICASFSEDLAKSERDFTRFVALPDPRLAVDAEGRKLCISGVKHGERVAFTLRAGLPAESGEGLIKDTKLRFYVRDRSASARFAGRAYILPLGGEAALPIETVNTDEVELTLRRVSDRNLLRAFQEELFARPLYRYQEDQLSTEIGEEVWKGIGETRNELNKDMTTRLPIAEAIAGASPGIYVMSARAKGADRWGTRAQQWFILSDIGLSTAEGHDGVHVYARSLQSAAPLSGLTVKLVSRSNRVLAETQTDASGAAHFSAAMSAGTGGAAPAMVLAEKAEEDIAFLSLTEPALDLSDRGVKGRNAPGAMDLFLTTDRGAYRAGETVHATALLRRPDTAALTGLPLTAVLLRPDGVEYARQLSPEGKAGGHVFSMPVASTAPRGAWTLEVRAEADGKALSSQTLLVEDFLPERIDFDIAIAEERLSQDAPSEAKIDARYLFGAPAAELRVNGELRVTATRELEAYPGFRFGPHNARISASYGSIKQTETDADGKATVALKLPEMDAQGQLLKARLMVGITEGSGRPVERRETRPVTSKTPLIGVKKLFDGTLPEGSEAAFDIRLLSPDLQLMTGELSWTLNRVNRRYQWYERDGNWRWEPITTRSKLSEGVLQVTNGKAQLSAPTDWGSYELLLEHEGQTYVSTSETFYAGWYGGDGSTSTPDTLELSLDKDRYKAGETARLRILPRAAGEAMVQVMSDRLISTQMVSLSAGENAVPLEVTPEWGAGAYVTVTHITPMQADDSFLPTRSIGLAYAQINPAEKEISVSLETLDETKPRQPLAIRVKADPQEETYLTLAAVDLGILNLTGFKTPDPAAHYFGQRKLGLELRDVYGRLIDTSKGALGRTRSGGGAGLNSSDGTPPPEDLVTFFSGPVELGPDGTAELSFDVPEFNGTLRLMAVVWSPKGVGSASKDVIIRDPIVLSASLPKFLSPGDQSSMLLELTHADGPAGEVGLAVDTGDLPADLAALPASVTLAEGERIALRLPLTGGAVGNHEITVSLTTPEGQTLTKSLTLPVRLLDPEVSQTRRFTLAGGGSLALDANLTASFRPGSARVLASAGPIAKFDVAGLLRELDRYPYGCTEQLTSAAMPLLYFSELSEALGLTAQSDVAPRIEKAVSRILTRQTSNGSFGLWYPSSGNLWLDAYVTDFLSRAKAEGFDVPELAFQQALANLQNNTNAAPDFDEGGQGIAYALYVLAREGQTSVADLRYYADVKAEDFSTPLARAQIGAALAFHGDQLRADAMFLKAQDLLTRGRSSEKYVWRTDYGTHRRDAAALIALAEGAGSDVLNLTALTQDLIAYGNHRSTQEMVWTLLAVEGLLTGAPDVTVNGAPLSPPVLRADEAALLTGQTFKNTGDTNTDVTLTTYGVPLVAPEATGYGYAITRNYFTLEGKPVDSLNVKAGDRLVTRLKVTPFEKTSARLIVNDPLPAGFEIDNPNLLHSGDIKGLDWLRSSSTESTEFRAERFIAAVNVSSGRPIELAYIVRAVTPGRYHHAPALVEDMYRPTYRATTGAGEVTVSSSD